MKHLTEIVRKILPIISSVALTFFLGVPGWAYEEIPVSNGGTITGTITLAGGSPRPMAFNLATIPDAVYCGRISTGTGWRIVEDFLVAPNNGLKDVVVVLKGVKQGKPFILPKVSIEAKDCDFYPFINVLRDRDEIEVINMDPVEHDIQGYETARVRGARVLFNRPLPMNPFHQVLGLMNGHQHLPGTPMVESIHLQKERDLFVMQCGFHPYMFSWGVVVKNPYYAITNLDGKFEINDIPPGTYTLSAWHAGMKQYIGQEITILPGQTVSVDLAYQAPQGRRSVHEMHDNPHFGLEVLGEGVEIVPSLRLQKPL
ncbi:carboxypeptidase-like regulatory domain-containing protein [Candidatus Nitronereus thalassa]|uniref:Carboxypeptidase-like regulatory domain-containing protein n=1 Tax=Candidatus Nitronereus thalassa TaxID=3020898 RepID=A0ABU3KA97_9BACT|nr:carboxypeptidase-like regulatory domain-containing protein [Candidatus Nitronereus thalassa]MDT7043213.1 carboxypeptidase-like regulatory domain-containing protein [Candidatus Nitronereus thalassa]